MPVREEDRTVKTERSQAGGQKLSHPGRDTASKRGGHPGQALGGFYFAVPHPNSTVNPLVPLRGNEINKDEDRLFFKRVTHSLERKRKVLQKKDKRTGEEACLGTRPLDLLPHSGGGLEEQELRGLPVPACLCPDHLLASQPPLQKPLSSDLDFRCLDSLLPRWVGVEREQGSLPAWGQRAAGFPQEHHIQPQQHLSGKPHWLFSTQTNTLEVNCLCHACASTLLASGEATGPEGRTQHSTAVWPETGHPSFTGLTSTQCL